MSHSETAKPKLTPKEKITIAGMTAFGTAIGALLGIIAYYQQWLG